MLNFHVNSFPAPPGCRNWQGTAGWPLQHALGAEVFAEERVPHANIVHKERRQQENHHQQDSVFQICQRLQPLCGKLLRGDFVQQLLKPAEGAQKTADKASKQDSQQNEKACDIIGKAELGRTHYRLKRPDRGKRRTPPDRSSSSAPAHIRFSPALIQSALEKVRQMQVGQQRRPLPESSRGSGTWSVKRPKTSLPNAHTLQT